MRPGTFSPLRLRLWLSLCLACVCLVCLRPTCPLGGLFVCLFCSEARASAHGELALHPALMAVAYGL